MKLTKYDFYSTVIGILLFVVVAALIALVMSSCATTRPLPNDMEDRPSWAERTNWHTERPTIIHDTIYIVIGDTGNFWADEWMEKPILTPQPVRPLITLLDTLNTECQHTFMMRTLIGCNPPSNQCNTCTCLNCGLTYKCN